LNAFPSEVIGGLKDCCTMLEMADAYATLANGGVHIPPTILNRVVFPDGSSVNLGSPRHHRVFTTGEAYAATQVLKTVIQSGTGTAANYGCPAAGKTGTAQNEDNAWFVGYTPQIATAVWVGYPQGDVPMGSGAFGGTLAAPIWASYMQPASEGFCGDFPPPITPWSGVAFVGPHSGSAPSKNSGNGSVNGNNPAPANPYNNPNLFAQPNSGPTTQTTTGGGGGTGGTPTGGATPKPGHHKH
jgi:penicillin-binding protein 1A